MYLMAFLAVPVIPGCQKDPVDSAETDAALEEKRARAKSEQIFGAGLVLGVADDGGLIVSDEAGERVLRSGEVTLGSQLFSRLE